MPLDPSRDYQIADAIEIVFPPDVDGNPVTYRRWTGTGNLTYDGQVYRPGGIAEIEDINLGASITDVTSITLAVTDESDRSLFLDHDPGPSPCKVIEFYRTRPKDGAWGAWTVDGMYTGKLSQPSYRLGVLSIEVQRTLDDVWRGIPLRWNDTDQQKRSQDDNCFQRADLIRRHGLLLPGT